MKKRIIGVTVILFAIFMSGCATHNASKFSNPYVGTTRSNLQADVSVGQEITGTSSATILFGLIKLGADSKFADGIAYNANESGLSFLDSVSDIKAAAAYNAITAASADVIVAPRYVVDVKNYFIFKKVNVKVTGFKGTLNGIK